MMDTCDRENRGVKQLSDLGEGGRLWLQDNRLAVSLHSCEPMMGERNPLQTPKVILPWQLFHL